MDPVRAPHTKDLDVPCHHLSWISEPAIEEVEHELKAAGDLVRLSDIWLRRPRSRENIVISNYGITQLKRNERRE